MSEHDTSYFDAEFTNEAVRLTPPQSSQRLETLEEMDEIQNNFTQFSFHHEVGININDQNLKSKNYDIKVISIVQKREDTWVHVNAFQVYQKNKPNCTKN